MKKLICTLAIIITTGTQACEVKNNDFTIIINYKNNLITYSIHKKDNTTIDYFTYNSHTDTKIGFLLNKKNKNIINDINIKNKLEYFRNENFKLFIPYSRPWVGNYDFPLPRNLFKEEKNIIGEFKLKEFTETVRNEEIRHDIKILPFGKQILIPKVKVILDPEMKTCIDFSGEPFEYYFGNKYIYEFNLWWPKFKEKTIQIWKAIIE